MHRRRSCARIPAALLLLALAAPAAAQAPDVPSSPSDARAGWQTALGQSLSLLALEHGIRISFQDKTRRELGGPFWGDYVRSLHLPTDWEDGDSWLVNYLGHPIHGAAAGYLWRDTYGDVSSRHLGLSSRYWARLGKSAAWIAVYSVQFEFGPLSEASIGNVGLTHDTRGWVDHVVTPAVGFGLIAAEDAIDKYLLTFIERHIRFLPIRIAARIIFNPSRSMANLAQGHLPWYRADRGIR